MITQNIYKTTSVVNAAAALVNGYLFFAFDNGAMDVLYFFTAILTGAAALIYWVLARQA